MNSTDEAEAKHKRLTTKQKEFIKAFLKHATNVSKACEARGMSRQTHYDWYKTNLTYKEEIDAIEEGMIDFAESALYKNIKNGKEQSILFFLKTRGKKRGYVERQEMEHIGDQPIQKIEVEFIKKDK